MSTTKEPGTSSVYQSPSRIDPGTLMRIKNLELRAKTVVEGFYSGLHRSPFHGFSSQFSEYRQYVSGDDLRYVDWKLYARTDRHYIKRFEDETNLRCYLLVDRSQSMNFGSLGYTKADYAITLAASFAYFINKQRDAVGVLTFHDQLGEYVPPRYRTGQMHRILVALEKELTGKRTDLNSPIRQIAELTQRRSLIVYISDMLADPEDLETNLGSLRSCGHDVIILQTLDPQEISFDFSDAALFQDLETGKRLYVDPATIKATYLEKFAEHESVINRACQNHGIDRFKISIDQPLENALFDYLQVRQASGNLSIRNRQASSQRRN